MKAVPFSRYVCFGILTLGGLASDLVSKWWVFSRLGGPGRQSDWSWGGAFLWGRFDFQLSTVLNEGALFGIGQGYSWLFAILSIVAAVAIVYWLFVCGQARSWWQTVMLSLILAGALGNLYDRLHLHGWRAANGRPKYGVRDFLDCKIPWIGFAGPLKPRLVRKYDWPVFNFADVFVVTGAIMLTAYSFVTPARKEEPAESKGEPAAGPNRPAHGRGPKALPAVRMAGQVPNSR